ncbi:MAG: hypothetical protein HC872_03095 [Gammaproteobacteria bacterium]|nr:hypothetical protein [Gammaproteobacteria bacterium]
MLAEGKLASPARSTIFGFRVPLYSELDPQAVQLANWILFQSSYSLARRRLSIDQTLAVGVNDFNFDYDNGMLKGTANLLPSVTLPKLQTELAQLGGDFARLSEEEYDAYLKQLFISAQDDGLRNEGLVAFAAQSWGKFGGLQYLQDMLSGKAAADLRNKTKALVDEYVKADNLVLVHGKGDK